MLVLLFDVVLSDLHRLVLVEACLDSSSQVRHIALVNVSVDFVAELVFELVHDAFLLFCGDAVKLGLSLVTTSCESTLQASTLLLVLLP